MGVSTQAHALGAGDVAITLSSGPKFVSDSNNCAGGDGPHAAYVAYQIENTSGGTLTGVQATLNGIAPEPPSIPIPPTAFTFAGGQAATVFIGTLTPGERRGAYWYVAYPCHASGGGNPPPVQVNVDVTVSDDQPGSVTSSTETITSTSSISANAGGLIVGLTLGNNAYVGQVLTMDVIYEFGSVGSSDDFVIQPTGNVDFNAGCFQLLGSDFVSSSGFDPGVLPADLTDVLYFFSQKSDGGSGKQLTIQYELLYKCESVTTTAMPLSAQKSGQDLKYTGNFGDASDGATIGYPAGSNPFTLTKSVTPTSLGSGAGGTVTYTVTVTNTSAIDATLSRITDVLPVGLTYQGLDATSEVTALNSALLPALNASGTLEWVSNPPPSTNAYIVLAGASFELVYTATLSAAAPDAIYTNSATGTVGDSDTNTAVASVVVGAPPTADLSGSKTGPATVSPNGAISYTIVITNTGPDAADGAMFSDAAPPTLTGVAASCGMETGGAVCGVVIVDGGNTVTSSITTLPSGSSVTFIIDGTAPVSGSLTNSATVLTPGGVADPTDPSRTGAGNNTSGPIITLVQPPNASPVAASDSALTQLNTAVVISVVANDTDSDGSIDSTTVDLDPSTLGQQATFVVTGEGTFSDDGSGNVTYTPLPSFTGTSSISYTVSDNEGAISNSATISVRVNAPPVANNDSALTQLNTPVTLSVPANDTDSDGTIDAATVDLDPSTPGQQTTVVVAGEGSYAVDGSGMMTFTPDTGFTGAASLSYTITDNDGGTSNPGTISVRVNAPPVATNDSALTQLNMPVTLSVPDNDSDSDGTIDAATVDLDPSTPGQQTTVAVVGEGSYAVDGSGMVTFTPDTGFTGTASLSYTITDNDGGTSNPGTISVRVNVPPVANNDSALTQLNTPVTLSVPDNDSDSDGTIDGSTVDLDPATPGQQTTVVVASEGTFSVDGSGTVTFTPEAGFVGSSAIAYTINDNDGGTSNTAPITVRVNAPPVAIDDSALTQLDIPVTLAAPSNDSDSDGTIDAATVDLDPSVTGQQTTFAVASEGTFSVDGSGTVTFTPEAGFTGVSSIPYTINDNDGATSSPANLTVTLNAPPVATDDDALTQLDTPVVLTDVTANDTDSDGTIDAASVDLDPSAAGQQTTLVVAGEGTFTDDGTGSVTFTPEPGFFGTVSIPYTVNDNDGGLSNPATITIDVNASPLAENDSATTPIDTPVAIPVLVNDSDPEGDPIQVSSVTPATSGTVTFTPEGAVIYTPNPSFTGSDSFTYIIDDPDGGSATATVTVAVREPDAANLPPTAVAEHSTTPVDTPITIGVLANDYDPGNDPVSIIAVDPVTGHGGIAVVNDNGTPADPSDDTIDYAPAAGFVGTDTFSYTLDDGQGGTDTAIVTVTVTSPAHDPVPNALGDGASTPHDVPVLMDVLANDTHPIPDALTLSAVTNGAHGSVSRDDNGTPGDPSDDQLVYSPDIGFVGHDTVTYRIVDANGDEATAAVTITVTNALPVATDDSILTQFDTPVTLNVTTNDTDSDGTIDVSTVDLDPSTPGQQTTFTVAGEGTFTDDGAGNVTFTPEVGFAGISTIPYTVLDETSGESNAATMTITVNAPPVAMDDSALTPLDTPVTQSVVANDTDSDGTIDVATVDLDPATPAQQSTFTVAGEGTFADDGAGNVTFTPEAGFAGTSVIRYTVTDNDGGVSNPANVSVTVNAPPVAVDDRGLTQLNTAITLTVVANDTDSDGTIDAATVDLDPATPGQQTMFAVAGEGVFVAHGAGDVTFTPEMGFTGVSTIMYEVSDNDGGVSNTATIAVTVNAPPVAMDDSALTQLTTPVTLDATANDTDSDGTVDVASVDLDPSTPGIRTTLVVPGEGTFTSNGAGSVTFTPETGFTGVASILYVVTDNDGGVSNAATLSVTVNAPPMATDDVVGTTFNTPATVDIVANDTDSDGTIVPSTVDLDPSTAGHQSSISVPGEGTFSDDGSGNVTFTPEPGFVGSSTIPYTIADNDGATSAPAQITVTISSPPVAEDDSASTPFDTAVSIPVLVNDADLDGDTVSVLTVSQPPGGEGSVTFLPDGTVIYTPDAGFTGAATFTYTIDDGTGLTATATVTVTVEPDGVSNGLPTAIADAGVTPQDTPVNLDVLPNDSDSEDHPLTITTVDAVTTQGGTASVSDNGTPTEPTDDTLVYTPAAGFVGLDTFTYAIEDGQDGTDTAIVTVEVLAPVIDPQPTAVGDGATTPQDVAVSIDVLANDTHPLSDPLTVTSVTDGAHGTTQIETQGTVDPSDDVVMYTPMPGFVGTDTFTYTIVDSNGDESLAAVTVRVINDPPLAQDDLSVTSANTPVTVAVLSNDTDANGDGLTIVSIDPTGVSGGAATIDDHGTPGDPSDDGIAYTPPVGFMGIDSVTYTIDDGHGGTDTATVTVTIADGNLPPIAEDDTANTGVDMPVVIAVAVNDHDSDGTLDLSTVAIVDAPLNGTVSIESVRGEVTYTPNAGFSGIETFTYMIADNGGASSNAATVTITVSDRNQPPTAVDDTASTSTALPVVVAVMGNDSDSDGTIDPTTVTVVEPPTNGTVGVEPVTGEVTYTPGAGFSGIETFTYTVADDDGAVSNVATVTVTVSGANQPPMAMDDTASTGVDTPVAIPVVANDSDSDGTIDPTTVTVVDAPANGTVSGDPVSGEITYTPNFGFTGVETFTYTVQDNVGSSSSLATVTVMVIDLNQPPMAVDDTRTTGENTPVVIGVVSNDRDSDGTIDPTTVNIVDTPVSGTVRVDPVTGEVTYTPTAGFSGIDTLTYTVNDDTGAQSNVATVTVTVTDGNVPPVAVDDIGSTTENQPVTASVTANDTDSDGTIDPMTLVIEAQSVSGTVSVAPVTGELTYTPNAGFTGTDTVTYTVSDNEGATSNVAILTLTVSGTNQPPVAQDDLSATGVDTPVVMAVVGNDSDRDGTIDPTTTAVVDLPANGTVSVNPVTGEVTYTPNPGFTGIETFTYWVADDDGASSNVATITVTVTDGNAPPMAIDDTGMTGVSTPVAIVVSTNDTDSDGTIDPTTVAIVTSPSNGTASVDPVAGEVTYTPNPGFSGIETFTYTIDDDQGATSNVATVTVTVTDGNVPPVAQDDAGTTAEGTPVVLSVPSNDSDSDGTLDLTTVSIVDSPANGGVSVDPVTGEVTYSPNVDFSGIETFTYVIADNGGASSNVATVTLTVSDINQPPVAHDDRLTTASDTLVMVMVVDNDTDSDGAVDATTVTIIDSPSNGVGSVDPVTGEVTYTSNPGFSGVETFMYTVEDNDGASSNVATVTITVVEGNAPPMAVEDTETTGVDTPVVITVVGNDTDSDGAIDPTTVTIRAVPSNGTASVDPITGEVTYTPNAGFSGIATFTYTVADNEGASSNVATVTVTVIDGNTPPMAVDDTALTDVATPLVVTVLGNDTDRDGAIDPTTVVVIDPPANGTASVDPVTSEVIYTPNPGFSGIETFTYTVADNEGASSNVATVTVTVSDLNQPPVATDDRTSTGSETPVVVLPVANDTDRDGAIDPTTVSIVAHPANGTVSVDPVTGDVIYTPTAGFTGVETFTYTVDDNEGASSNVATVTVTVSDGNVPPVAVDDSGSTPSETPVVVTVLSNDSDSDGIVDPTTVSMVSGPANGTTSVDPVTGHITYTPSAGFAGVDTLTYTVRDDDGSISNVATLTLTVINSNPPPVAHDDSVMTAVGTATSIPIMANDIDPDGVIDPTSVTILSAPSNGTVAVDPVSGSLTYTPNGDFVGVDTVTYTVEDDDGATSNVAAVTITVNDVNVPPTAQDDGAVAAVDTPVTIAVVSNDTDQDGTVAPSTVMIVNQPASGTGSVDPVTGEVTYTPATGFTGADTFTYAVQDDDGALSETATVTVTVIDGNVPPVAMDDTGTTGVDAPVTVDVLSTDRDPDGSVDPATVAIVETPSHGTVLVDPVTGEVTYTPNLGFSGMDTLTYTVQDDDGATSNEATLTLTVSDGNVPPVATNDAGNTAQDTSLTLAVLNNDSDPDGSVDPATVVIVETPSHGTVSVDPVTGEVTYTPTPGFSGMDTLTYTVQDDQGATSTEAMLTLTVSNGNQPPEAMDDHAVTADSAPVTVPLVLNDTDLDGSVDPTTVTIGAGPATGSATIDPVTGDLTYTPNPGFSGIETMTYTVRDNSEATSNLATVTLTVTDGNLPPTAIEDTASTPEDTPVLVGILNNDTDGDGTVDAATVTIIAGPGHGAVSVDPVTGEVTYTPTTGFSGIDTVTYTVADDSGATSNAAALTLTVSNGNAPPTAMDDTVTTPQDMPTTVMIVSNDTDSDGAVDPTGVTLVEPPANGSVSVDPVTGVMTYTPNPGFTGVDTVTYTVADNRGAISNIATLQIMVTGGNQLPMAVSESAATSAGQPVMVAVLDNDSDPDGSLDPSSLTIVNPPMNGTVRVDPVTGDILYRPETGFTGIDTFTYTVQDQNGAVSNPATVMVAVTNTQPDAVDDTVSTDVGTAVMIDVVANDTDDDEHTLSVIEVVQPANGTVTINPDGTLTYTPNPGLQDSETFTYTVSDGQGGTANATVTITFNNQSPVAMDDTAITAAGESVILDVLANDSDGDGDALTVTEVVQPANGTVTINPDGTLTYTPNRGFQGPDTFTYTISDGQGGTDTATVTIDFTDVFDPPLGRKIVNASGLPELEWRMVWINGGNATAIAVRITDQVPTGTAYVPGSLTCEPRGDSTLDRCEFEAAANRVIYEGNLAPDPGATTEDQAVHEVVIAYRAAVPPTFFGTVENQAQAHWDANGDNVLDDDIDRGQRPITSDDPAMTGAADPTIVRVPEPLGACLFQLRVAEDGFEGGGDSEDHEGIGDPTEGAFEGGDLRQMTPDVLALTTPTSGHVVSGSSVAVAAIQGPSTGITGTEPLRVTVANTDLRVVPDIVEMDGVKTEAIPGQQGHTVVTAAGVLIRLPADALAADDTLEISEVSLAEVPTPLPGDRASGFYRIAIATGASTFQELVILRLPYADLDQSGVVDHTTVPEATLTLWRYATDQGQWVEVPGAVVIPQTNAVLVETHQAGLVGLFRATNGRMATLGGAADDVVGLGSAQSGAAPEADVSWETLEVVSRRPYVIAWDTTSLRDGHYELRAVCAADAPALAAFQTAGDTPNSSSRNCFIATAAYGSPMEPQVQILRGFRDRYLLRTSPGRWIVNAYYRLSPPLAALIGEDERLRTGARLALAPVVWTVRLGMGRIVWAHDLITGLLFVVIVGCGWYATRYRI